MTPREYIEVGFIVVAVLMLRSVLIAALEWAGEKDEEHKAKMHEEHKKAYIEAMERRLCPREEEHEKPIAHVAPDGSVSVIGKISPK